MTHLLHRAPRGQSCAHRLGKKGKDIFRHTLQHDYKLVSVAFLYVHPVVHRLLGEDENELQQERARGCVAGISREHFFARLAAFAACLYHEGNDGKADLAQHVARPS